MLLCQNIGEDIKMPTHDIVYEARMQDEARLEQDMLNMYRINGIKPEPAIEDSPFVEEDLFNGSFEEILEYRKRVHFQMAHKKNESIIEKCLEIDIEEWDRLSKEYDSKVVNPLFDLDL